MFSCRSRLTRVVYLPSQNRHPYGLTPRCRFMCASKTDRSTCLPHSSQTFTYRMTPRCSRATQPSESKRDLSRPPPSPSASNVLYAKNLSSSDWSGSSEVVALTVRDLRPRAWPTNLRRCISPKRFHSRRTVATSHCIVEASEDSSFVMVGRVWSAWLTFQNGSSLSTSFANRKLHS
uniref:(northern house mosquito) hypothetical protein n=1 Tax=Culex pipiens TaxID=7175 RepID=A0A8D8CLN3_CULPI